MTDSQRWWALLSLIVAGEVIFFLPFVIPRVFRPTYLDVFGITNFELGTFFSAYGFVAIAAYLVGGPLADRYPAHKLMALALVTTGLGGLFMITVPSKAAMLGLYAFWGMTTILLFWASLMRATRMTGGEGKQGFAFGLLDGGRGLVAAIVGALAVWVLSARLPADVSSATASEQHEAFKQVITFFVVFVFLAAVLVFFVLKPLEHVHGKSIDRISWSHVRR